MNIPVNVNTFTDAQIIETMTALGLSPSTIDAEGMRAEMIYLLKHHGQPMDGSCAARSKPAPKDPTLIEELGIKPWDTTKNFIRAVDLYLAGKITWNEASQMISRKENIGG